MLFAKGHMSGSGGDSVTAEGEPAATLAPGSRLGKYEIRRLLGAGGMGAVYEALHTEIGKRVAVKVLAPELAAAPGARSRFLREAQLTSTISHPNIVNVNDMGNEGGRAFIVMEFLDGEDLSSRLDRTGPMPVAELVDIMLPVCSAVDEAHRAGITHRDLKPQNIFLSNGPRGMEPKVLDFGISKGKDTKPGALTGTGMIGTPFYFAPEQILDAGSAGPASDQYALGVILYECLTGRRPYEGDSLFPVFQAIVDGNAPLVGTLRPDLPVPLQQIIARAMHKAPTARFESAAEMGRALLPFASVRARTFWEQAFNQTEARLGPAPAATLVAPPAGRGPGSGRAVPATTPMPRTPLPAPLTPVPSGTMPLPSSSTGGGRRVRSAPGLSDLDLRPRRRWGPVLAVLVGLGVIGGLVFVVTGGRLPSAPAPRAVAHPVAPAVVEPPPAPPAVEPPPAPRVEPPPVVAPRPEPPHAAKPVRKLVVAPKKKPPAHPQDEHPPAAQSPRIVSPNSAPILE